MDQAKTNDIQSAGDADRIIAEECEALLASQLFIRSPVLSRLFQFLVDHRLRGGRSTPKAYAIATEALGRSADFDPAVDSYPRVMVGRLRNLLDRYYAEIPWVHRLRIPQGSYEVVVQNRAPPPRPPGDATESGDGSGGDNAAPSRQPPPRAAAPRARRLGLWVLALVLVGLALFAGWRIWDGPGRWFVRDPVPVPLLEVSTPQSGTSGESRALARALDSKLRDGLRRFDLVDLLSAPSSGGSAPTRQANFRLDSSIVRLTGGDVDITLVLNRVADQNAIWSQQLRLTHEQVPEFVEVEPLVSQIAGDYGIIVRDQISRQPDNFAPGFPCLAQFNRMRQMRNVQKARQVDACLRTSLEANPHDSVALTALSLLRFGDWQPNRASPIGAAAFAEARALAERSYENGRSTSSGLFAMARANFYMGNCAAGNAMGDAAMRLNRYDADMAGFLGLFKLGCNQAEEGEALIRRSLELDDSYPGVPAVTLAFLISQRGDQAEALAILNQMPSPTNLEPQYLTVRAIVLARQGDMAQARHHWKRLLAYTRQPADAPPELVLRQFLIGPVVIQRAVQAVRDSGLVPPRRGA